MSSILQNTRLHTCAVAFAVAFVAAFALASSVAAATTTVGTSPAITPPGVTPPAEPTAIGWIRTDGMRAIVGFQVNNGCPEFLVRWGDGKRTVGKSGEVCTMIAGTKRVAHTYTEPGRYRIVFNYRGQQISKVVTIKKGTASVTTFGLADVAKVTYKYVDPNEMMADEEYTLYTIVLKSGRTVTVKAFAFTTVEMRNKAFRDAGYTGDVAALIKIATEETEKPVATTTSFTLTDVKSVTKKEVDPMPGAVDDEYTLYTITLLSGKVIEVKNYGNAPASMNDKAFRDAGYTGDIAALKAKATATPTVTPFALTDVKYVISKNVDPMPMALDDEYTLFTIVLKSLKMVEVKVYGFAPASMNDKAFRDAGYTGDIAALKAMANKNIPVTTSTGVVQGASITDIKAALAEILAEATKLQAAVASLKQ